MYNVGVICFKQCIPSEINVSNNKLQVIRTPCYYSMFENSCIFSVSTSEFASSLNRNYSGNFTFNLHNSPKWPIKVNECSRVSFQNYNRKTVRTIDPKRFYKKPEFDISLYPKVITDTTTATFIRHNNEYVWIRERLLHSVELLMIGRYDFDNLLGYY